MELTKTTPMAREMKQSKYPWLRWQVVEHEKRPGQLPDFDPIRRGAIIGFHDGIDVPIVRLLGFGETEAAAWAMAGVKKP